MERSGAERNDDCFAVRCYAVLCLAVRCCAVCCGPVRCFARTERRRTGFFLFSLACFVVRPFVACACPVALPRLVFPAGSMPPMTQRSATVTIPPKPAGGVFAGQEAPRAAARPANEAVTDHRTVLRTATTRTSGIFWGFATTLMTSSFLTTRSES